MSPPRSALALALALLGCARAGGESLPTPSGEAAGASAAAGETEAAGATSPDPDEGDGGDAEDTGPEAADAGEAEDTAPDTADAGNPEPDPRAAALAPLGPGDPALPFALVEIDEARAPTPSLVDGEDGGPWVEQSHEFPSPASFAGVEVEARAHMPGGLDGPTEYWIDVRFPAEVEAGTAAETRRAIVASNLDYCETQMSAIQSLGEPDPGRFVLDLTLSCRFGEDHAVLYITKVALVLDVEARAAELLWIGFGDNTTEYGETWRDDWSFDALSLEGREIVVQRTEGEAVADPETVEDEGWTTEKLRKTETFRYELPPR